MIETVTGVFNATGWTMLVGSGLERFETAVGFMLNTLEGYFVFVMNVTGHLVVALDSQQVYHCVIGETSLLVVALMPDVRKNFHSHVLMDNVMRNSATRNWLQCDEDECFMNICIIWSCIV